MQTGCYDMQIQPSDAAATADNQPTKCSIRVEHESALQVLLDDTNLNNTQHG